VPSVEAIFAHPYSNHAANADSSSPVENISMTWRKVHIERNFLKYLLGFSQ
jgi:hypothetical protein